MQPGIVGTADLTTNETPTKHFMRIQSENTNQNRNISSLDKNVGYVDRVKL